MNVLLVDYGAGNLHSIRKALEAQGADVLVSAQPAERLASADALVLPGVGAFGAATEALADAAPALAAAVRGGMPCLGVCLGMQLLFDGSEEGAGRGLGVLPGTVRRMEAPRVPHMGWNRLEARRDDAALERAHGRHFYFAHTYVCEPRDDDAVVAWTRYAGRRFASAVRDGATLGVQFHPEKSGPAGLRLIGDFLELARRTA